MSVTNSGYKTNFNGTSSTSFDLVTSQGTTTTIVSNVSTVWNYFYVGNLVFQYPSLPLPRQASYVFPITSWTVIGVVLTTANTADTASVQSLSNSGFYNKNDSSSYCLAWGYVNTPYSAIYPQPTSNFTSTFGTTSTAVDILSNVTNDFGNSSFLYINIGNMLFQFSKLGGLPAVFTGYTFAQPFNAIYGIVATPLSNSNVYVSNVSTTGFMLNGATSYVFAWGTYTSLAPASTLVQTYLTKFGGSNTYNVVSNIIKTSQTTDPSKYWSYMYVGQLLFQFTNTKILISSTGITITFPISFGTVYGAVATADSSNGGVYVSALSKSQVTLDTGSSSSLNAYCFAYGK